MLDQGHDGAGWEVNFPSSRLSKGNFPGPPLKVRERLSKTSVKSSLTLQSLKTTASK